MATPRLDPGPSSPEDASHGEPGAPGAGTVGGERGTFIYGGARSLQSRMGSLLAAGLMISMGAAMLTWYYAEALSRPAAGRGAVRAALPEAAGQGITLPSFASIGARQPAESGTPRTSATAQSLAAATLPRDPLLEPPLDRSQAGSPLGYGPPPRQAPRAQPPDRRLSGEVFASEGGGMPSSEGAPARAEVPAAGARGDALDALLSPAVLSAARAQVLPTQRLLLPKGAFIDCTLETAIDSTLPGMTTCVTASDTFGADGTVVLLERGTKLIGQTGGEVRQGEARIFVVWTEARTPSGVVVRLDSPGTDALGRSGLAGKVNRHFWQRFGAAALVSMIDGAVQSEVQSSSRGGTVVLDPTGSEDVLTDILRGTVNIPPTIRVRNGALIQVLVARDVDFRPVYDLESR